MHTAYIQPPGAPPVKVCYIVRYKSCHILGALHMYRIFAPLDPEDNIKLPIIAVNLITAHILMTAPSQDTFSRKLDRLRKSTVQDNQLTRLSHYINTGFPCEKKNLPIDLQDYWNYRDTLSIENGLLTCGSRIIVPHEM